MFKLWWKLGYLFKRKNDIILNDDAFLTVTLIYQRKLLNYTENENI